ncbi:MAG TPA: ATP-binding cassette domain-containing protein [Burkholderiales bacterium]|nr:ATP-binding cassette domain-containing protein [Burkholderiales bacterium]
MDRVVANAAIRVAGLVKRFGKREALAGVDLEVAPGEAFGLVGANGAGKTTLLKCLLDLCAFDAGRIEIFGAPSNEARARARLAYVPERFLPPHYLRGREFLELTVRLGGVAYEEAAARALLAELALDAEVLERPVRELSKGMTQKLGLAGGFLLARELTVLDEPMSGLDPASRLAVKSVLARLHAEGRTLLFTSHVLADVEELCTTIAVLDRGRLCFRGAPAALTARYGESSLERAFLRCVNGD